MGQPFGVIPECYEAVQIAHHAGTPAAINATRSRSISGASFMMAAGPVTRSGVRGRGLARRDQIEQIGQHRRTVDVAPSDFVGPDLQRFLINPEVDLAPEAPFGSNMLADVPLAFVLKRPDISRSSVSSSARRLMNSSHAFIRLSTRARSRFHWRLARASRNRLGGG